jgi:superfamily II DNA/RNA helicase
VFCENADMLLLLRRHLQRRRFPFVYLDGDCRRAERTRQMSRFAKHDGDAVCLLSGVSTSPAGAASIVSNVDNVVFYDGCWRMASDDVEKWMRFV